MKRKLRESRGMGNEGERQGDEKGGREGCEGGRNLR